MLAIITEPGVGASGGERRQKMAWPISAVAPYGEA
jgi:hypothetical protein